MHSRDLGLAATCEGDEGRPPVGWMGLPRDEAAGFECVYQIGDIAWRAPQNLTELSLRPLGLQLQLPEEVSPGSRQTAFRQARVHAGSQHHAQLE
ncbi:MAG TPA: hypothetical protein VKV73_23335 [Chloroflexota bacterium]|nr:hypothetical protein [Chloroflexota bacterium]